MGMNKRNKIVEGKWEGIAYAGVSVSGFESLFVDFVMVVKVLENDGIIFDSENEDKTFHYMSSLEGTEIMSEVFEVTDGFFIQKSYLVNLFVNGFEQGNIFSFEILKDSFDLGNVYIHNESDQVLNSSAFIDFCGGLSAVDLSFLTTSSFNGSSSIGCQSIFSQNSQSSSEISPVCLNLADISLFINLTVDFAINVKSIFVCSLGNSITSSMIKDIVDDYINVSSLEVENG
jgi:hypothetical protein